MPINSEHLAQLTDVVDKNGDKVGGVGQIYLDDASGQPAWVSVKSGLFGLRESFVPLAGADVAGGNIAVPYTKDFIKDAPRVDAENHLDDSQQATLFSYYGVDRSAAAGSGEQAGGGSDQTATFGSEQTAQEMYDGRSEGEPALVSDTERDGALTSEYTTPGTGDELTAGTAAEGSGTDLGSGDLTEGDVAPPPEAQASGSSGTRDAAAIGAGAAAGAGAAGAAAASSDTETTERTETTESTETTETAPAGEAADAAPAAPQAADATYQQANPAAQVDWAAEQTPEEPVSTEWSVPSTDPSQEEATKVGRAGYASDQPAAHSSAYEGHGGAGSDSLAAAASSPVDPTTDEGAVYAADADAANASDAGQFGTVEPVTVESTGEAADSDLAAGDDAVTGAAETTGTGGYAGGEGSDSDGFGAGGAVMGGAAAGGVAAAGYSASQSETTAYEVPGAETGEAITETDGGAAFDADLEQPVDAGTAPSAADGVDLGGDAAFGAGADAQAGESGEPEVFGAQGYRPDRDGTEMSDEEREQLNKARGVL